MSAALWSRTCAGSLRNTMVGLAIAGLVVASLPVLVIVTMSFSAAGTLDFPTKGFSLRWYAAALQVLGGDAGCQREGDSVEAWVLIARA